MWMVSALVPRDFWVGLIISDEEMKLRNEIRQSDEWNHYVSNKEAIEVQGTIRRNC